MTTGLMEFGSMQEELDYYRSHAEGLESALQETRAALDEFQVSSRELEEELEKELQSTETAYKNLKARCEHFKQDADEWKSKFTEAKHEQNKAMTQMQREIDILRATEDMFRKKILELELDNDDLERTERAASSSLSDLEVKLNKAIERNVILENEITAKDNLTEQTQRLKDELSEMSQELSIWRDRSTKQNDTIETLQCKLDETEKRNKELQVRQKELDERTSSSLPSSQGNDAYPALSNRLRPSRALSSIQNTQAISSSANPVKMVQEMVGRVRSLEARLQSCRALVTPLLHPPPSYSSTIPTHSDTMSYRSDSPSSLRSGSPMQLMNIKARRPSEYMRSSPSPMDISEEQ